MGTEWEIVFNSSHKKETKKVNNLRFLRPKHCQRNFCESFFFPIVLLIFLYTSCILLIADCRIFAHVISFFFFLSEKVPKMHETLQQHPIPANQYYIFSLKIVFWN